MNEPEAWDSHRRLLERHDGQASEVTRLSAEVAAYRDAFRRAFTAYLVCGHGQTEPKAAAECDRVMAETDARLKVRPNETP